MSLPALIDIDDGSEEYQKRGMAWREFNLTQEWQVLVERWDCRLLVDELHNILTHFVSPLGR